MHRSRFTNSVKPAVGLLMLIEAAFIGASAFGAMALSFRGDLDPFPEQYGLLLPKAAVFTAVVFLSLLSLGLYQLSQRLNFKDAIAHVLAAFIIAGIVLWALWSLWPPLAMSLGIGAMAAAVSLVLLLTLRFVYLRHVDTNRFRRRSLIYGSVEPIRAMSRLRRRADRRGFQIVGLVLANGKPVYSDDYYVTVHDRPLTEIVDECHADEIIVAMDQRRGALPVQELLDARLKGIEVLDLAKFMERECRKIYIDLIHPSWMVFGEGFRNDMLRRVAKRAFDLVVALAVLFIFWPLVAVTAVAIKLESGIKAPVFYRQMRVGIHGVPFKLLKFRSMRMDAEADGEARWTEVDDPRITRVGHWIRKWRIDEIPQLYNVVGGYMSIVGPRPERPCFVKELSQMIPYYNERHVVKPGITGWAQLRYQYASSEHDAREKLQYDLYYVKNQSLILDLVILLQTIEVVLWSKGAR